MGTRPLAAKIGTMRTENIDARRKRALFRSSHRGMQETDLLLGAFARRHLEELSEEQVQRFEVLLEEIDNDLFDWITGKKTVPAALDHDVMKLLQDFKNNY